MTTLPKSTRYASISDLLKEMENEGLTRSADASRMPVKYMASDKSMAMPGHGLIDDASLRESELLKDIIRCPMNACIKTT